MRKGTAVLFICLVGIQSAAAKGDDWVRLVCTKPNEAGTTHFALDLTKKQWSGGPEDRTAEPLRIYETDFVLGLHDGADAFAVIDRTTLTVDYKGWYQCQPDHGHS